MKERLLQRLLKMALSFLEERLPEWRKELCDYSDAYSERTDNEWDDMLATLLRAALGVPK